MRASSPVRPNRLLEHSEYRAYASRDIVQCLLAHREEDDRSQTHLGSNLLHDRRVPQELDIELGREWVRGGRVLPQVVRVAVTYRRDEHVVDLPGERPE